MVACGLYRHYKGKFYQVIGMAKHSETEEEMVVYRALYGSFDLWVRPLLMFLEPVEQEGTITPRFVLIQEARDSFPLESEKEDLP